MAIDLTRMEFCSWIRAWCEEDVVEAVPYLNSALIRYPLVQLEKYASVCLQDRGSTWNPIS